MIACAKARSGAGARRAKAAGKRARRGRRMPPLLPEAIAGRTPNLARAGRRFAAPPTRSGGGLVQPPMRFVDRVVGPVVLDRLGAHDLTDLVVEDKDLVAHIDGEDGMGDAQVQVLDDDDAKGILGRAVLAKLEVVFYRLVHAIDVIHSQFSRSLSVVFSIEDVRIAIDDVVNL